MRTNRPDRALRDLAADLWRRSRRLGPASWLAAAALLAGLVVAGYFTVPGDAAGGTAWVHGGHVFPAEKLATVRAVLAGGGVRKVVVDGGRVGVPADQLLAAHAALKKAKLDPRTLGEIVDNPGEAPWIEDPQSKQQRQDRHHAEIVETLIKNIPGIADAKVIFTPLPVSGLSRVKAAKVLVDLKTEDGDPPPYRTIREIRDLVLGESHYLVKPEDVTLTGLGRLFLVAGDRARLKKVLVHAREEELGDEIAAKLRPFDGFQVGVTLDLATSPTWKPGPILNQPAGLDAEPAAAEPPGAIESSRAAVAIRVPAGFYRRQAFEVTPGAEPTAAALGAARERANEHIAALVRSVVPAAQLGPIQIEEAAAAAPAAVGVPAPAEVERPRIPEGWRTPALVGVGLLVAIALVWAIMGRRPSPRPARVPRRHVGEAAHGVSANERVRSLVRRNPEAAAGVLQRWVGQGGGAA